MLNKKVTRKQFLLSAISMVGLFALGGVSKKIPVRSILGAKNNTYGDNTYGGIRS